MKIKLIDPKKIKVGERLRQKIGDLKLLQSSIERFENLLQPIVVTEANDLVCGERRLKAWREVYDEPIPCVVIKDVDEEMRLWMEHDENVVRLNFSPLEAVPIAEKMELLLRQQLIKEDAESTPTNGGGQNQPAGSRQTTERAALGAGFSSRGKYEDAKRVVRKGSDKLKEAMDTRKIPIGRAAEIAKLPKAKQDEIVDTDGKLSIAITLRDAMNSIGGRISGIRDQYGTVAGMFKSEAWKGEDVYEVIDTFYGVTKVLVKLNKEMQDYEKKHPNPSRRKSKKNQ